MSNGTEFLDDLGAELTGGATVPDQIDDDTALPEALSTDVEQYNAYAADRDAHLVDIDQDEQQPDNQHPRKQVPLTALQEERQRRQALAAELEQSRAQQAQLRAQFEHALAQQQQAQLQAQQQQVPDFADDPEGHVRALAQQFEQRLTDIQGAQQAQEQQQQVAHELGQVGQQVAQIEAAFMSQVGEVNYRQAHDLVEADILQNLQRMHPMASMSELQQAKVGATFHFLKQCQASGINPAEHIYSRARQLGFRPGHRVPGQQRPAAPTSLSSLPGTSGAAEPGGRLTAAAITNMSDAEFAALCASMKRGAHVGPGV